MPPTSVNDSLWPPHWRLTRPPPLSDLRSRSPLRSRSTLRSSPGNLRIGQRGPRSTGLNYRCLGVPMRLRKTARDETKVNRDDFDRGSVDPDRLHKAQQAWVSLVTSCKGAAFDIMNAEESASEAWAKLVQHYRAGGLKERRRLTIDVYMMKMELGVHPRKFLLRVDQMVKELERVDRLVDPKGIDTFILISGLTPQYDAEVRVLESSSDWLTREWIERAVMNQYERLEFENLPPGAERSCPPAATAGTINPPSDAPFAPAQITLLCNAVNSRLPAVRRNRTDIRGMENMVATAEAPGTAEVAEMAEAAKAAEWAATVEVEAVRVAAGAAVSQRKVSWISDPAIRPLAPTATSV